MFLNLSSRLSFSVRLISSTRKHGGVILYGADYARVIGPVANGSLKNYSLIVALALTLGLDAIGTGGTLFTALDAAFATRQAAGLCPFAHLGSGCRNRAVGSWGDAARW